MTPMGLTIMTDDGQPLPFAKDLREALGCYARAMWPRDTAKQAARAWDLSPATASNVLKGHASDATITHILRRGSWRLGLALLGAVLEQSLDDFIASELEEAARERDRRASRAVRLAQAELHLRRPALARVERGLPPDGGHHAV